MMLHTKYKGSMPCGFRREDLSFHLEKLCYLNKPFEQLIKRDILGLFLPSFVQIQPVQNDAL